MLHYGTGLITSEGIKIVHYLKEQPCTLYDGTKWTKNIIYQRKDIQPVISIAFQNLEMIKVTEDHKLLLQDNSTVKAKDIKFGDNLKYITSANGYKPDCIDRYSVAFISKPRLELCYEIVPTMYNPQFVILDNSIIIGA
jgi:hypothetical protein